jgi:hypothetical protein
LLLLIISRHSKLSSVDGKKSEMSSSRSVEASSGSEDVGDLNVAEDAATEYLSEHEGSE